MEMHITLTQAGHRNDRSTECIRINYVQPAAAVDQRLVQDTGSYDGTDDERVLSWGVEVTPVVGSVEADGLL